jgi:hypothetical protein
VLGPEVGLLEVAHVGGFRDDDQLAGGDGLVEAVGQLDRETHVLLAVQDQDGFAGITQDALRVPGAPRVLEAVDGSFLAPVAEVGAEAFQELQVGRRQVQVPDEDRGVPQCALGVLLGLAALVLVPADPRKSKRTMWWSRASGSKPGTR